VWGFRRTFIDLGWACIFAILVVGLYFRIASFGLLVSLVLLVALVALAPTELPMQAVDWSLLLVVSFEIATLPFSQYSANSIRISVMVALSALMFVGVRLTMRKSIQVFVLGGALGLCGAWLALNAIAQFGAEARRFEDAGFPDLLAFRSRLITPPASWIQGEWFTVVLLVLPFSCAVPVFLWSLGKRWPAALALVLPSVLTIALTLTLSRAVFWSTILFFCTACALLVFSRVLSIRTGGMLLAGVFGVLILILACESVIHPGLIKAYVRQHTSQARSMQGRVGIWARSFEVLQGHPLVGVGSSNAALMLLSTADEEKDTGFAGRTFSLPVQLLLEKGIVGVLLYMGFLVLVARECLKAMRYSPPYPELEKRRHGNLNDLGAGSGRDTAMLDTKDELARKTMGCCFAAGLVAVLCREFAYSSLMEHAVTMVLVAILAALICRAPAARTEA